MARSQTAAGVGGRTAGEGLTGMKALGVRDLTYRVAFLAQSVAKGTPTLLHSNSGGAGDEDNPDADVVSQFTKAQRDEFLRMGSSRNIYGDLVASLAPMIHGHADIKKGILLMLLGGVHKRSAEGVRLRGDLNVCIVGDPSTAKSQFLKVRNALLARSSIYSFQVGIAALLCNCGWALILLRAYAPQRLNSCPSVRCLSFCST